jgi:YD repeat-containing protein
VTALMTQTGALANPATRVTTYAYDAGGNLVSTTDALKQTESYTYDALGHKLTFKNKLGNTWNYEYDAAGHMVRETAPPVTTFTNALLGTLADYKTGVQQTFVTAFEYDALNNLVRRTEAAGISGMERVTEYRYDAQGRQVQIVLPDVQVYDPTKEDYAVNGEHTVHEVASGVRTVTVTYDTFGNAVSNTDVGGKVSYKIYDRSGNVRWEVDAAGYATGYERDVFGQVTAMTRYGNVVKAGVAGAAADNFATLLNLDNGKDRTIRYTYDAAGRQLTTSEPVVATYDPHASGTSAYIMAGRTTVNEYNTFGEVYRRSVYGADAKGAPLTEAAVTRYYYDVRGQKTAQIDALSDVAGRRSGYLTKFAYDNAGNLTEQVE